MSGLNNKTQKNYNNEKMKKLILSLIPENLQTSKFQDSINKRNIWLIYLRYGAVIMLTVLSSVFSVMPNLHGGIHLDTTYLWIVTCSILVYNIVFHIYQKNNKHNGNKNQNVSELIFSLTQIIADLISLLIFIYFTGGVETPLYAFFIFHIIIGSLFLSRFLINSVVTGVLLISIIGAYLEYSGLIPHHSITGLHQYELHKNSYFLFAFFSFFGLVMYLSVYLASSIAKELYSRESELLSAYKQLEQAEENKMKYVISVVHDLKTPIAAATTYINMMLEGTIGEISEAMSKPLNRSKIRLDNAISTINNILYISQLKLQPETEDLEIIDLNLLFSDIYNEFKDLIQNKNIDFKIKNELNGIGQFKAEPKLLKFALANLISNSYKYTEDGGKIIVSLTKTLNDIKISVADNGIGIPENEIGKIMTDFYRSSISKKKNIEGTGLGMSIVNQIIQRYKGEIVVKSPSFLKSSDVRLGTEMIISFPETILKI